MRAIENTWIDLLKNGVGDPLDLPRPDAHWRPKNRYFPNFRYYRRRTDFASLCALWLHSVENSLDSGSPAS